MKAFYSTSLDSICMFGTSSSWLEDGSVINSLENISDYPSSTPLSESISKDFKKRGFTFVGPTIIYAFMQAVGMVVDHTQDCFLSDS